MAKGISGLPPGGLDEFGSSPGHGSPLWTLLYNGVTRSTDTANADYNIHTDAIDGCTVTEHLGGPLQLPLGIEEGA